MGMVVENKHAFIKGLSTTSIALPGSSIEDASKTLETFDLPTTRTEAWKYTRVAKLGKIDFHSNTQEVSDTSSYIIDESALTLIFVNGYLSQELSNSLPTGLSCKQLSACSSEELKHTGIKHGKEVFNALNTCYLNDGIWIEIAKNAVVDQPIQIIHITKGEKQLTNFRTVITARAFSKASIIQGFFSEDSDQSFTNSITEIIVEENAHLTLDKLQYEEETTTHINSEYVNQAKDSTFTLNTITLNGGLVRNNIHVNVNGQNCTTNMNGAYLLKGKQHVDNHTTVDHIAANCNSNELYKGVIDEKATAVFNGKVFVRKDAQKINAFQSNGNVLLSDDANVNSKPELEIYADDVKCSHGSTTGQLDEEAVFYLRARGLSEKSARKLMVSAFIGEVLEHLENDSVVSYIERLLKERFGWDFN